jgi:hypothetical protein
LFKLELDNGYIECNKQQGFGELRSNKKKNMNKKKEKKTKEEQEQQ